jgi:phosphatidyl-myo-inositol alpha-mannosyltransferase
MKTLKIGLVLDDSLDTADGVQQYVLAIGGWLRAQGHEVHYLVGETKRTDIPMLHSLSRNKKVRFNGNHMSVPLPASRRKIRSLLKSERFDVLHVQVPYSPFLAGRIISAAPKGTAIFGTFHILPYNNSAKLANKLLALVIGRTMRRFNKIYCVSSAAKKFAEITYGIKADVLPNVVDEARFSQANPLPPYDDETFTIMFLGRLVPRKGCMTLLEAANILNQRKNLPPFRVVVCGKGPLETELKQYVVNQLLTELVVFTGFVPEDEKPRYVASADIMAFPSTSGESFGIVLLEGMASGRAVVLAGDNPGYRSVLEPQPELLFTPGDAFELANKLTTYLRDSDARKEILAWENKYIHQFDINVVGKQLLEAYEAGCKKSNK